MALSLKHAYTSAVADGGDATKVQPSNWNAEHSITLAADMLLGRIATPGAAQEIPITAAGRALIDDADVAAQLVTLGAAPLASPVFTGSPKAPTQGVSDNTTNLATTAWVRNYTPSGIYTPVAANVANVASFTTPQYGQFARIGNIVFFTLQITLTPTTASVLTSFTVIPPIVSAFASVFDCIGTVITNVANNGASVVRCDTATGKIFVSYTPSATGAQGVRVCGSYLVS